MKNRLVWLVTLTVFCGPYLAAQSADETQLKQVIIFGRHAVRTPILSNTALGPFSSLPYPDFAASGLSVITPNGQANETILGGYFRLWLTREGLLTGHDAADASFVYVRANNGPLIVDTAQAFAAGMLPAAAVNVDSYTTGSDPLFNPVGAGVARLNERMAVAAVNGRIGGSPQSLATAYAAEMALVRSVLFNYAAGTTPPPATPPGKIDVTAIPITATAGDSTLPVNLGGLAAIDAAIDPFIMEYTDGMPMSQVGWGQLSAAGISQVFRLYDLILNLEFRTPYLASVQSSNIASHIVRSLLQAATGNTMAGALGNPADKVVVLIGTNTEISGLAGLLNLDWLVPGYQADVSAPGGALVFQLRQSLRNGEYVVRASYITQTMDQLRNRTALTLSSPPAVVPVFIPGCNVRTATFDCPLATFLRVTGQAIDTRYADLTN